MSVFWNRKRSSCWPLPRLSVFVSSTLCHIVSLIPGSGLRFPFLLSRASWQRLRIPLPLLLGLRALMYRPYQTQEIIAMGDCYFLCGRSGVTLTALLYIVRVVSGCFSPQGVARRRYRRPLSPSGSGRQYHVPTSSRVRNSLFLPLELGRLVVLLSLSFQEEFRCRPGVEGGYVTQACHLYESLPEGPCPSVPRHLPLGSCGGGTGLGLILACSPGHSTPK